MIARNIALNLIGMLAPVVLAFGCIPPLIRAMGVESFGVLTLVWAVLGYFSLFDIGIGRALTKAVAEHLATGDTRKLPTLVRTAIAAALALGTGGALTVMCFREPLLDVLVRGNAMNRADVSSALLLVALALPFVTATAALRGSLEATQRFGMVNLVRLAMGVFSYVGPLLVVQFSSTLQSVVGFLLLGRLMFFGVHLILVLRAFPRIEGQPALQLSLVRPLLTTGSWMAVSNLVSPLLTYLDRVVVAAVAGSAMLAYYSTPYEAIMRVTVVPDAVMGVMFPAFTAALRSDLASAQQMFGRTFRMLLLALAPVALVVIIFAPKLLELWVGAEFAKHGAPVLQILAAGMLVNSLARLPFTVIQSLGRPDLTAKAHLVELLPFIGVLWVLSHEFGIVGAAVAWLLRASVDGVVLEVMRRRLFSAKAGLSGLRVFVAVLVAASVLGLAFARPGPSVTGPSCVLLTLLLWSALLTPDDRQSLLLMTARLQRRLSGSVG